MLKDCRLKRTDFTSEKSKKESKAEKHLDNTRASKYPRISYTTLKHIYLCAFLLIIFLKRGTILKYLLSYPSFVYLIG